MLFYSLFPTAIGVCGICWSQDGICGLSLPEATESATKQKLLQRHAGAVATDLNLEACLEPGAKQAFQQAAAAVKKLQLHLSGEQQDLRQIALDLHGCSPFAVKVYLAAQQILAGATCTYGELAELAGAPGAARAVGRALGANPIVVIVPCHRIMGKGNKLTGFSAYGGCDLKLKLLNIEKTSSKATACLAFSK